MILNFYLLTLGFAGTSLGVGAARRNGPLVRRSLTILVLIHLVVLALVASGPGALALAGLVGVAGAVEAARQYHASPLVPTALALGALAAVVARPGVLPAAVAAMLLLCAFVAWGPAERVRSRPALYLFALLFLGVGAGAFARLGIVHPGAVIALVLLLQLNEATGYFVGGGLGRRRLFPRVSPNKTLEGYAGGAVATAAGIALLHTVVPVFGPFDPLAMLALWALVVGVGNAGDLLVSALKRKLGTKDMGGLLPGHGGMLDRCDGLLLTAPVLALLWGWLPAL